MADLDVRIDVDQHPNDREISVDVVLREPLEPTDRAQFERTLNAWMDRADAGEFGVELHSVDILQYGSVDGMPAAGWIMEFEWPYTTGDERELVESLVGEFRRMHETSFPTMVRVWIGSGYPEFEPGDEIEPFGWPSSS